jgi:ABC-type multidrug transport system fused ATPase/permease subunit
MEKEYIFAKVPYDKEALKNLMKFNAVASPVKWIVNLGLLVIAIILLFVTNGSAAFPFSVMFLAISSMLMFLTVFSYFIKPAVALKDMSSEKTVINSFTFTDDGIDMSSERLGQKGASKLSYANFCKLYETKIAFYLFVNSTGAVIVTKSCIENGSVSDLRALLNEKITNPKINKLKKGA